MLKNNKYFFMKYPNNINLFKINIGIFNKINYILYFIYLKIFSYIYY